MKWTFEAQNGRNGALRISDAMIDSQQVAAERAAAEILENGYKKRYIRIRTYIDDIKVADEIEAVGSRWQVQSVKTTIDPTSHVVEISAKRWSDA